ncbi:MAG: hypothetical protein ACOC40_02280 [Thermoplasmatota archaeon]
MKNKKLFKLTLPVSFGLIALSMTILPYFIFVFVLISWHINFPIFILPLILALSAIGLGTKNLKIKEFENLSKKAIILGIISTIMFFISTFISTLIPWT